MLIEYQKVKEWLEKYSIQIEGVLHVGAHNCEEIEFYEVYLDIDREDIIWIDAISEKVEECKRNGIETIYQAVITDKDDEDIIFNVSNNIQSSSIFDFGTHAQNHSWVSWTGSIALKTTTIDSFFQRNNLDASKYSYWNMDIQGAELLALKGAESSLKWPKAIYLEVNTEEVYKGCGLLWEIDLFLAKHGFTRVEIKMTEANWGDALYIRTA